MINPLKKQAKMAALQGILNAGGAGMSAPTMPGMPSTAMQSPAIQSTNAPLTTGKGIKESLTKKIRPKGT